MGESRGLEEGIWRNQGGRGREVGRIMKLEDERTGEIRGTGGIREAGRIRGLEEGIVFGGIMSEAGGGKLEE